MIHEKRMQDIKKFHSSLVSSDTSVLQGKELVWEDLRGRAQWHLLPYVRKVWAQSPIWNRKRELSQQLLHSTHTVPSNTITPPPWHPPSPTLRKQTQSTTASSSTFWSIKEQVPYVFLKLTHPPPFQGPWDFANQFSLLFISQAPCCWLLNPKHTSLSLSSSSVYCSFSFYQQKIFLTSHSNDQKPNLSYL